MVASEGGGGVLDMLLQVETARWSEQSLLVKRNGISSDYTGLPSNKDWTSCLHFDTCGS
jgi:hypothetical protein